MPQAPIDEFARLHAAGCFALPNPWSAGTARLFEQLGYRALGTTSAGLAFDRGRPDTPTSLPLDAVLSHVAELVEATSLPVSADFQAGYADDPEGVEVNVARCLAVGVAGLSIEDATGDPDAPLFARAEAVERIAAARAAIDRHAPGAILTGRCEAFLVGAPDPLDTVLSRLDAYAAAGADCLYAPGVTRSSDVAAIVDAVAPKPVNVLVSSPRPGFDLRSLAELGVRRISVGSAFARVAWAAVTRAAREVIEAGTFDELAGAAPFAELNARFEAPPRG